MANISSYNQLSSWNEDDDLLFVQQPDAPKKAHPSQVKQYVEAGDFEATGEVIDGHGNILDSLAGLISQLNDEIDDLASKLNWKRAGAFNANGNITLNYSLDSASEIMLTLFLGMPRQTVLIETISRLKQYNLFPDFMTSDGRVYAKVSYIDATHLNISQLTGLSAVGPTAQIIIAIR